ncbi:hypothetical protein [Flavobacterium gilvum]|uniref:Uncharacterized protein n=1 Tax=Flavobacterium gilvum TaxID=1492737 RepID=A0AAC9I1W3_9FLAO|nr:hypothetical protein [Flavobacterium gilvum]AOW08994.1 hypothetical protein EM308_05430 [Flavobacterium gilvum]KFC60534.1 hypothetical protein FEM08_05760 [Flavobacterium gilvum]
MKKGLYILFLILFLNCTGISKSDKQEFGKVKIGDEMFTQNPQSENLFICKDHVEDFDNGFSKIELNPENIKILNSKNDGYESTQIEFVIDKNLKIYSVKYTYSDDVEDGSKTEYKVIDAKININKNPFEQNSKQIISSYLLTIKETNIPGEFWKFKKEREYYFKGKIECK